MKRLHMAAAFFFALTFSAWLGRAEMHTDDTGILVGLIGLGGFFLSLFEPRCPWLWGTIVPGGIILVNVWRKPENVNGLFAIAGVTLGIAFVGSYAGAFVRRHMADVFDTRPGEPR
jgi:hypothetical protein